MEMSSNTVWLSLIASAVVVVTAAAVVMLLVRRRFKQRMGAIEDVFDSLRTQLTSLQSQVEELVSRLQAEGQHRQHQVDKLKLQLQLLQSEKLVQLGEHQGSVSAQLAEEVRRQLRDLEERIGSIPL